MTRQEFIDTAIIALASSACEGTPWSEVVAQAHALADAREAHTTPVAAATHRPRMKGGRIPQDERERRMRVARDTVLAMVQGAPDGVYSGGKEALVELAPCGRNQARAAVEELLSQHVLDIGYNDHGGKVVRMARAVQGVTP